MHHSRQFPTKTDTSIFGLGTLSNLESMFVKDDSGTWCSACGYSSMSHSDVVRHIEAKHMNMRISCKFCPRVCHTRLNLKKTFKKLSS